MGGPASSPPPGNQNLFISICFLRGLNLVANTTYALRFKYAGTSYPEKMEVRVGSIQDAANLHSGLQIFNNINIVASGDGLALFTPTTTGVYYFGFHAYSEANQNALDVDDIDVSPTFILPLAELRFSGVIRDGNAALDWTTLNEVNISSFDLERSTDGLHFTRISNIKAMGGMSRLSSYAYLDHLDNAIFSPAYYYRLKVLDRDGSFVYSKIITFHLKDKNFNITASPNPFRQGITLAIRTVAAGNALATLSDMSGKIQYQNTIQLQPGKNTIRIDGISLTTGFIYCR